MNDRALPVPLTLFVGIALGATAPAQAAAPACAQVFVRQTATVPQPDGTRILQFKASVETAPSACTTVQYDVFRQYLRPNGTTFEGAIPMRTEVRNGTATVFGQDTANTRGVVYWWAKNITCEACPASEAPAASAAAPARTEGRPATTFDRRPIRSSGGGGGGNGAKIAAAGGAGAATLAGLFLIGQGAEGATDDEGEDPTPTPGAQATATPAPTPTPTAGSTATPAPAQATPMVYPGSAPPPAATNGFGELDLATTDPIGGGNVRNGRNLTANFTVNPGQAGTDMRLQVELYSGGQLCLRDVTAPLPTRANQQNTVSVALPPGTWRCPPPFRTTLMRAYFNDGGEPKFSEDFPIGWDFIQ